MVASRSFPSLSIFVSCHAVVQYHDIDAEKRDWLPPTAEQSRLMDTDRCTVPRIAAEDLDEIIFEREYRHRKPVLLTFKHGLQSWAGNPQNWTRWDLRHGYGMWEVTVGWSEFITHLGGNGHEDVTLQHFLDHMMHADAEDSPEKISQRAYVFDRSFVEDWEPHMELKLPPYVRWEKHWQKLFLLGASGTGASFHYHHEGWNLNAHGNKRWWLYPPCKTPPGGHFPTHSAVEWLARVYPTLSAQNLPIECVQRAGEILYVPDGWYHAVINIGDTLSLAFQRSWSSKATQDAGMMGTLFEHDSSKLPNVQMGHLKDILRNDSACSEAWYQLGQLILEDKLPDGRGILLNTTLDHAAKYFKRALAILPTYVRAKQGLGAALAVNLVSNEHHEIKENTENMSTKVEIAAHGAKDIKAATLEEALRHLEQAAAMSPRSFHVRLEWGLTLKRLGRHQEALAALDPGHMLSPRFMKQKKLFGKVIKRYFHELQEVLKGISTDRVPNADVLDDLFD